MTDPVTDDRRGPTAQLAARVRRLRTRAGEGGLDRALLLVGSVLLPLGVLVVVLGWLGASHTVLLFEQLPYIISGGLLGVALVFVGGFVYFAYWQTLQVRETRAQHGDLVDILSRIERLLRGGLDGAGNGAASSSGTTLVATATGSMVHRADCPAVAGRTNLRPVATGDEGFEPCKICQPLARDDRTAI